MDELWCPARTQSTSEKRNNLIRYSGYCALPYGTPRTYGTCGGRCNFLSLVLLSYLKFVATRRRRRRLSRSVSYRLSAPTVSSYKRPFRFIRSLLPSGRIQNFTFIKLRLYLNADDKKKKEEKSKTDSFRPSSHVYIGFYFTGSTIGLAGSFGLSPNGGYYYETL